MKNILKSKEAVVILSLLLCVIIGLSAALFFQRKSLLTSKESFLEIHRIEMMNDADNLILSLNGSDVILSYHYAMSAADNASKCGERQIAEEINKIAMQVVEKGITDDMSIIVGDIISGSAAIKEKEIISNMSDKRATTAIPGFVARERLEMAKESAERVLGGEDIVRRGAATGNGSLLFSCSNAYALIDEKTSLPIEAAISLDSESRMIDDGECVSVSMQFLDKFFSKDMLSRTEIKEVYAEDDGTVNVVHLMGKRKILLSMRGENQKIVRFLITDESKDR